MAEVVGVVAAAVQLATASLSLLEMTRKIKGASRTLQNYHNHFQELHSLSNSISENPLLQTPEIGSCTESILSIVKANNLASLIQKKRWHHAWAFISRDKDLQDTFVILEQRKATLSLVIEHLQAKALHNIQFDIRAMSRTPLPPTSALDNALHREKLHQSNHETGQLQLAPEPSVPATAEVTLHQTPTQGDPGNPAVKSHDDAYYNDLHRAIEEANQARAVTANCSSLYFECKAGSGSEQVNGNAIIGNAADASKLPRNIHSEGVVMHIGSEKRGRGRQINGNCLSLISPGGDEEKSSMPSPKMTWVRPICDEQGVQINGNVVDEFHGQEFDA